MENNFLNTNVLFSLGQIQPNLSIKTGSRRNGPTLQKTIAGNHIRMHLRLCYQCYMLYVVSVVKAKVTYLMKWPQFLSSRVGLKVFIDYFCNH